MLNTKVVNTYLGTHYTVEEIAAMDPLFIEILLSVKQAVEPPQKRGK